MFCYVHIPLVCYAIVVVLCFFYLIFRTINVSLSLSSCEVECNVGYGALNGFLCVCFSGGTEGCDPIHGF